MKGRGRTKIAGLALAAFAGAAVMVVELGVARVLTPVFGGSISVWAIVIATTMLALAAGYAFGGYRADRIGGVVVASRAAVIGALLCAVIPLVRVPLIEATIGFSTLYGATVVAIVLIAPALFFLSQVSPALIRGLAGDGATHVGVTAGGIYAISTLGSLFGTLAAVWLFLYLPLLTGFVATAVLVVMPVLLLRPVAAGVGAGLAGAGAMLMVSLDYAAVLSVQHANGDHGYALLDTRHSPYGELRVIERDGRVRYMVVNGFDQGGIFLETGVSAYNFDDGLVGVARMYAAATERVLLIGLGPGVIATTLTNNNLQVDVVEIDAEVVRAARDYFGYRGEAIIDDGRRFLQRTNGTWDVIIVDAFAGGSPPWQLYTQEAFTLYQKHLNPGGVVVLNVIGNHLDPAQRPALEAVVSTARQVFSTVDVYPNPWVKKDLPMRNIFIAAATAPLDPERREQGDPFAVDSLLTAIARSRPVEVGEGRVLTDDSAPLEPLVRRTTEILRNRIQEYIPVGLLIR
ncbi:MAG: fused MFS/spermidine synthase [Gammaproteobacteria bacterium]